MTRLTWAAAALAATVMCSAPVAHAADPVGCKLGKVAELPLKFEDNKPMVRVAINGRPGWFVVDTGADGSNMFGGAARAFGLSESTVDGLKFYGVGGIQDAKRVIVSQFGLGDATVKDVFLISIGHRGSPAFAGLLGRDFLDRLGDLEFDLAGGALRIWRAQDGGRRSLAYWTKTPTLAEISHAELEAPYIVKVRINGRPVDAELDSGAATTVVTPDVARRAGVAKDKFETETHSVGGIGEGQVAARIALFDSVAVGDEEIKHTRLEVADLFALNRESHTGSILQTREAARGETEMLLGADFLRSHRVLVAASQGLLYFTYSGGPIFQVVGEAVKPKEATAAATPDPAAAPPK